MKKTILALLISSTALAADVCTNQEGAIIYDSATKVSRSLVIVKPRVQLAGHQEARISAENSFFCVAMGYQNTSVGNKEEYTGLVASFTYNGALWEVSRRTKRNVIDIVTCWNETNQ